MISLYSSVFHHYRVDYSSYSSTFCHRSPCSVYGLHRRLRRTRKPFKLCPDEIIVPLWTFSVCPQKILGKCGPLWNISHTHKFRCVESVQQCKITCVVSSGASSILLIVFKTFWTNYRTKNPYSDARSDNCYLHKNNSK